jgi:hypothetical protein
MRCRPGPQANGLTACCGGGAFDTIINVPVGKLIASSITGVTKVGDNTAAAEVQLTVQPTPVYGQHQAAFDKLDNSGSNRRRRTSARATFQLFDDGWRLENIQ